MPTAWPPFAGTILVIDTRNQEVGHVSKFVICRSAPTEIGRNIKADDSRIQTIIDEPGGHQ